MEIHNFLNTWKKATEGFHHYLSQNKMKHRVIYLQIYSEVDSNSRLIENPFDADSFWYGRGSEVFDERVVLIECETDRPLVGKKLWFSSKARTDCINSKEKLSLIPRKGCLRDDDRFLAR